MNPQCAKCAKTVYPVEKLNCLDKIWHKKCFTCQICNMTLNMKTYKGYNKYPYCNAHYPTTKPTTVADTPENLRLRIQSQNQSNVTYKKDYEESKGHYTAVTDDPEVIRAKQNMNIVSQVKYTGGTAEMRLGTSDRGAEGVVEGVNPHQPGYEERVQHQPKHHVPEQRQMQTQMQPPPAQPPARPAAPRYVAQYDYTAADDDEVSFVEGDVIQDVNIIDDGWVEGRVSRTGQFGMIPANYLELQ
uniref:LIM and SH3 domain protein 2 n=1 Tax=Nematostella vectensis TaxID=45351 RepID=I2G9D1_NEMVE|nr:LIM and SH3 domain protein 2 [Nematostella vectensis]